MNGIDYECQNLRTLFAILYIIVFRFFATWTGSNEDVGVRVCMQAPSQDPKKRWQPLDERLLRNAIFDDVTTLTCAKNICYFVEEEKESTKELQTVVRLSEFIVK